MCEQHIFAVISPHLSPLLSIRFIFLFGLFLYRLIYCVLDYIWFNQCRGGCSEGLPMRHTDCDVVMHSIYRMLHTYKVTTRCALHAATHLDYACLFRVMRRMHHVAAVI